MPKPLTTAIPATHMPSPLRKLASLGTLRRTKPSPPANHAQPARARRRDAVRANAASTVFRTSVSEAGAMREEKTHDPPISWRRGAILSFLLRGGPRRRAGRRQRAVVALTRREHLLQEQT